MNSSCNGCLLNRMLPKSRGLYFPSYRMLQNGLNRHPSILYVLSFLFLVGVLEGIEEQVSTFAVLTVFFFILIWGKMGWKVQQRGVLKRHRSCPGGSENSTSSCPELCREGWFLLAGFQLPWLVLLWPAGWYQSSITLISKHCSREPHEPYDWVTVVFVLQGGKDTSSAFEKTQCPC